MATVSENDPIDGGELKKIILERISNALDRDCTLTNDIAYAGFQLDFQITLGYKRSKTTGTLVWGNTGEGDGGLPDAIETAKDHYESDSPNTAREAHGLPVPVMVATPAGMEKRRIHVNRKGAGDAKATT
jgi:hypothetical protein